MMVRTFSERMLGLPGRAAQPPPPKQYSESERAVEYEKQMLSDVHEARKEFLSQLTRNPIKFAKTCSSCLQMIDMDGEDYASTVPSQVTSGQSSNVDMISMQSSIDEQRIARILQEYEDNQNDDSYGEDEVWTGVDQNGRRVTFSLQEYLYN